MEMQNQLAVCLVKLKISSKQQAVEASLVCSRTQAASCLVISLAQLLLSLVLPQQQLQQ